MKLSMCAEAEILNISYLNISIYISSLHRSSLFGATMVESSHEICRGDVRGKPKRKKFVIYLIFRRKRRRYLKSKILIKKKILFKASQIN
jgi:hypothetical protein